MTNSKSVAEIIYTITDIKIDESTFKTFYHSSMLFCCCLFLITYFKKKLSLISILEEIFYLMILYTIFHKASLIWSFAIHFVFWHSIPSLIRQVGYLYGNYKMRSFKEYFKSSFIYWFASLIGLGVLYVIFANNPNLFITVIFVMLACITFPHVWIISKLGRDY
jgi:Brp/Blh family beta-carotene 15,15'-monooxygenase